VVNAPDPVIAFAEYAQQKLGVPWATKKDLCILRKKTNEFFSHYPKLNFYTLCRVVDWCRSRDRRYDRVWKIVDAFRYAWRDGAIPELMPDQAEDRIEERINVALCTEKTEGWRRALIGAQGVTARRRIIDEWEAAHGTH
jgi:hypothetical protein